LRRQPFPAEWLAILEAHVPFFSDLQEHRARFLEYVAIFAAEKHFLGAGGLEIDDEIRVVISAAAVRLVLHIGIDHYNRLTEIVVYPSHYHHPDSRDVVFGEAHNWGVVVLSWDAVEHGLANPSDGHDTATHEFAHVLDREDGTFDGTPELRSRADYAPWAKVMSEHYFALRRGQEAERRVLRDYGGQNEAEFFAVATETFFERPALLREKLPDLYRELARFYGFDPAVHGKIAPS
jgi:Mlc titration factor MtfA (ptsG expression regulator)